MGAGVTSSLQHAGVSLPALQLEGIGIGPFDMYKLYSSKVEICTLQAWYWLAEGKQTLYNQ